jgi:hypothetical protein
VLTGICLPATSRPCPPSPARWKPYRPTPSRGFSSRSPEPTTKSSCAARPKWIYRGGRADLVGADRAGDHAPLIEAVTTTNWLPGQAQVFIHGEAQAVMHNLRPYIRKERGVDAKWASISGYWRRGRTEELFREWKRELAQTEAGG